MLKVSSLISFFEDKYPSRFSLDWDNCCLQVGSKHKDIHKVLFCLTLTTRIVEQAISFGADLVITHHPLIFKPLSQIDTSKYFGKNLESLLKNNISVYSMHTNFDVNQNGVSDVLAEKYGFKKTKVLSPSSVELYKLVIYVPKNQFEQFRSDFLELKVGDIGNYSHCSFCGHGEGTFLPNEEANPFIGQKGVLEKVEEVKLETIVKEADLDKVVSKMKEIHPYEEPAYDIYPMKNKDKSIGMGRYVVLEEERKVSDFLSVFPGQLGGNISLDRKVKKIAFCGGSGSSLVNKVVSLGIDLYITGDIDYHTAVDAEEQGLTILDIGHEQSEIPSIHYLGDLVKSQFPELEIIVL